MDSASALKTVCFRINEFKHSQTFKGEARPGRLVEVTTPKMIKNIYRIVIKNWRSKVRAIAKIVGISVYKIHNIFYEKLEKAVCKVDAIVDHQSKTYTKNHFAAMFVDA